MTLRGAEVYYLREHGEGRPVLKTAGDVDNMINALLGGAEYHNLAELHSLDRELLPSGFPDHELLVGVDRSLPFGVVEFMDAESGNLVSLGKEAGRGEVTYYIDTNPTEFPERAQVSIELVRKAVKEFVLSGGRRPTCVEWQVPEIW
jgi:hypothetical protein